MVSVAQSASKMPHLGRQSITSPPYTNAHKHTLPQIHWNPSSVPSLSCVWLFAMPGLPVTLEPLLSINILFLVEIFIYLPWVLAVAHRLSDL